MQTLHMRSSSTPSFHATLCDLVTGVADQCRAMLLTTSTVPEAKVYAFIDQASMLLKTFEDAVKRDAQRPEYAIRNLDQDTQDIYETACTYLRRLQSLHAPKEA